MVNNNIERCYRTTDKRYINCGGYIKDENGNLFIPWHKWNMLSKKLISDHEFDDLWTTGFKYYNRVEVTYKPFSERRFEEFSVEIARLRCSGIIDDNVYHNIITMLKSEDIENFIVASEIIRNYRRIRLDNGRKSKKLRR